MRLARWAANKAFVKRWVNRLSCGFLRLITFNLIAALALCCLRVNLEHAGQRHHAAGKSFQKAVLRVNNRSTPIVFNNVAFRLKLNV